MLENYFESLPDLRYTVEQFVDDIEYESDSSNYNVVDGEEGDYGTIIYSHNGIPVCIYINHGGDSEEYIFTRYGKAMMKLKLMDCIEEWLK